jgi:myosin-5
MANREANKYFWVPDEAEVWALAAQVGPTEANGLSKFKLWKSQKTASFAESKCLPAPAYLCENENFESDDLVTFPDINQGSILYNTKQRFAKKLIYTSCGMVLMSVNPFHQIPNLYGLAKILQYKVPYGESSLPSHLYLIPSRAYESMCRDKKNQSILISGESGAGIYTFNIYKLILNMNYFHVCVVLFHHFFRKN